MHDAWLSPSRPERAPRWVRDLELIGKLLEERAEVTEQLAAAVAAALAGQDLGSLSAAQWLRALLVQQTSRNDAGTVAFLLNDSRSLRAFCRLVDVYIPEATIRANLRCLDRAWSDIELVLGAHLGSIWKKRYRNRVAG